MALIFFLAFAAVWYLPLFLKHRKINAEPAKYYLLAFLFGIASTLCASLIQFGYGALLYVCGITTAELPITERLVIHTIKTFIIFGCAEEFMKYFGGRIAVKRVPDLSKAGCMLIFGMVGLGFEFMESVVSGIGSDLFTGILRGFTDLHIFWQIWMGMHVWEAWKAKKQGNHTEYKKNILCALLIPIVVHFVFDWFTVGGGALLFAENDTLYILSTLAVFVFAFVFMMITLIKAYKVLKAEKAAAEEVQPKTV